MFDGIKSKAQWADNHGFVWFSVMDHLIQIGGVGAPTEPFMEGWTVLSALAAVTGRIRLATPPPPPCLLPPTIRRIFTNSLLGLTRSGVVACRLALAPAGSRANTSNMAG